MGNFVRHYVVGNDAPPWMVAGVRALGAGFVLAMHSGTASWLATGHDVSVALVVSVNVFFGTLVLRWGLEGKIDQGKNGGKGNPTQGTSP